jgi:hypothetical protein
VVNGTLPLEKSKLQSRFELRSFFAGPAPVCLQATPKALEEIDRGTHSAQAVLFCYPPQQAKQGHRLLSWRSRLSKSFRDGLEDPLEAVRLDAA